MKLTVFICSFKHLFYLLIRESLWECGKNHPELCPGDESLSLLVEDSVRLPHLAVMF